MERVNTEHIDTTVTPTNGRAALTVPGIMVSATLAASMVTPYGGGVPQYQIGLQDANISTIATNNVSKLLSNTGTWTHEESETLEAKVSAISREEIDAKLALNKSELELSQTNNFSSIEKLLIEVKGEIGSLRGELSGNKDAVSGQIDGLKTSISTMQWMVGTVLAMIGIAVAILAIPGIDKII